MATEWYLMSTPYEMTGGFESDDFDNFSQDAFAEALDSSLGVEVELYSCDLSESKSIKAIVNGTVQDTKLKALKRQILTQIGTVSAGMYIKYKNRFWLLEGVTDDNSMYEKTEMVLCNYELSWLNDSGEPIKRWAFIESASQYNNGEWSNTNYIARTDSLLMILPYDVESAMLPHGKRFIVDRRCKIYEQDFDSEITVDTSKPLIVYRLTRTDNVLYDYLDSGHAEYMLYQDEQHESDGYYLINGHGYWLCDIPPEGRSVSPASCGIQYDSCEIFNGIDPSVFFASFVDNNGNKVSAIPQWNIDCDFSDELIIEYDGDSIYISCDNRELINKSFVLSLSADGYDSDSIVVTIRAFL